MTIRAGDRLPPGEFQTMTRDGVENLTTEEVFGDKKVVLFAVPGAFTPTCSDTHLPGFLAHVDEIKSRGVDTVACLAVNDVFVLEAWSRQAGAAGHLLMLADGSGDYVRELGLELDLSAFGMGRRSARFSALVDDGVVELLNVEEGPGVTVSSAEEILQRL